MKVKVTCCQVWWPILGICALHLTHPSAHTAVNTHTHREHTPGAVGSQCCGARGAVGGSVPCSRAPQSWYWRWKERWLFTPPTYNPCRTWDSNPRPSGYKSDSLSIRPRRPLMAQIPVIWRAQTLVKCVAWFILILSSHKFCVWKGNSFKFYLSHTRLYRDCITSSEMWVTSAPWTVQIL